MIYLDHNATSPLLPQARSAWLEAVEQYPGNPSSPHRSGARAERALDEARQRLARVLGCEPTDLVWTSGATEACNSAIAHAAAVAKPGVFAWVSAIEHPAVRDTARYLFRDRLRVIPTNRDGVVDVDWISTHLARERPALIAVMAANNETGVLQPWRDVHALCVERGVTFFCDATQWCGRLPMRGLGKCDFVAGSAHKFGGPRGVGFLKVPAAATFVPLLRGGPQEERRRAGTENVAGVLSALAALEWCEQQIARGADAQRRTARDRFERGLTGALSAIHINGAAAGVERLWNTVSVIMPEMDCRVRWVVKLDKAGFAVSTGSACSSGSEAPSPVLTAMGVTAEETARALRISTSWLTPDTVWDELHAALVQIAQEIRRNPGT